MTSSSRSNTGSSSRVTFGIAVAVSALALLLSACGDRFTAPAAVVDGSRITEAELEREVQLLAPLPTAQPSPEALEASNRKDIVRQVLALMIRTRLVRAYADANGITVTEADVDKELQDAISQVGGQAAFDERLKARNLTVGGVRRSIEYQVLFQRVEDQVARSEGGLAADAAQGLKDQAFQRWLRERLSGAEIEVNPRFGRLDPANGVISPIRSTAG